MDIAKFACLNKFSYARRRLSAEHPEILDIGCGNHSPTLTKHWFPGCRYSGADIQQYNNSAEDLAAIDTFYPVGIDGSGYAAIPRDHFDLVILHHVIEHMPDPKPILRTLCSVLKPGGYMWIAFPSPRSLSLPPAAQGTLQFCDDDSHVYVPDIREVSNILLANDVSVRHAGTSRDPVRTLVGAAMLPWALLRWMSTGKLHARGLWYILGFEDHVFGQRNLRHGFARRGLPPV
ncbi:MAG TPA: class I SAM-dependent methyltransferase [Acidobacteriaceae bacterium]|nr:class I SAM-dependent methyltransferase [Acidobacteriaceae bacterium]